MALCFAANLGFKEIHVEARPGDVMAWPQGAGAAGPAQDVPTGSALDIYYNYGHHNTDSARTVVMIAWQSAYGREFEPRFQATFCFCVICT